ARAGDDERWASGLRGFRPRPRRLVVRDGRRGLGGEAAAVGGYGPGAARGREASLLSLVSDDLDEPAPVALAVELDEEHPLPRAELQLAVDDRHGLACRTEEHRHAVGVAVAYLHVLGADVLGATVPVVVGVVALVRDEPAEQHREVVEEPVLELVDANAAGRVRRVDAGDPL